jgi:hypothetical protein
MRSSVYRVNADLKRTITIGGFPDATHADNSVGARQTTVGSLAPSAADKPAQCNRPEA